MFYIQELQTNNGKGSALPMKTAETKDEAMSIYHGILASAAISEVEYHSCIVMDEQGRFIAHECYEHKVEEKK